LVIDEVLFRFIFAFLAGISSLCHPCSFSLLPGYVAYLAASNHPNQSSSHGTIAGLMFTAGIVTTLLILGALISSVGGFVIGFMPWLQIVVGIAIIGLGVVQMFELNLPHLSPRITIRNGLLGLYIFGLAFGLVISTCSAPIFFSLILYSFISGFQNGILALASYGLGVGAIVISVSIITGRAKTAITNKLTQYSTWINRIIGSILIIAGAYICYISLPLIWNP
jgi:cytochrome c biogenesis protein CcdA